jgi:hypothetical protein
MWITSLAYFPAEPKKSLYFDMGDSTDCADPMVRTRSPTLFSPKARGDVSLEESAAVDRGSDGT